MPVGRLLVDPAQLIGYETDGIGYKRHPPDAVAIPAHANELIAVIQTLQGQAVPFTLRGAGTSLSGGPVAAQGGLVIHTSRLRRIETINNEDLYAVVESGVVLNQLCEELKTSSLRYPPDPSSGAACTLGGNVAANAGGAHCFRYGVTGNYVLGVEVVLLDGTVVRYGGPGGGRGPWRDDWKRIIVGSEGTLGAITRIWVRLAPASGKAWTIRAAFPDAVSASAAISELACHPATPAAIELMDARFVDLVESSPMAVGLPRGCFLLLTELEGPAPLVDRWVTPIETILRSHGAVEVASGDDPELRNSLWRARKVAGGLMGQISPDYLVQDAVIPRARLSSMLELIYAEADAARILAVNVFHAGDGNLHPNFLFDARRSEEVEAVEQISNRLMHHVISIGGTLSGEHGIGNDKSAYMAMHLGPHACAMQLAVPRVFNPHNQLNPLKVFPERRFA